MKTHKEIAEELLELVNQLGQCAIDLPKPYSDKVFFAASGLRSVCNEIRFDIDKTIDNITNEVNKL